MTTNHRNTGSRRFMRCEMGQDNSGTVEIGYIFTFFISAILLTFFTLLTSNIIQDYTNRATELDAQELLDQVENGIETVVSAAMKNPYNNMTVKVAVQGTIRGQSYNFHINGNNITVETASGITITKSLFIGIMHLETKYASIKSIYKYIIIKYSPQVVAAAEMSGDTFYIHP